MGGPGEGRVAGALAARYTHVWWWRARLPARKGQPCTVTARGKLNTIRVDFPDGFLVFTSRYAVRGVPAAAAMQE